MHRVSVVLDDPVTDFAFEGRGLDLTTAILVLVLAPLQVVLCLKIEAKHQCQFHLKQ